MGYESVIELQDAFDEDIWSSPPSSYIENDFFSREFCLDSDRRYE